MMKFSRLLRRKIPASAAYLSPLALEGAHSASLGRAVEEIPELFQLPAPDRGVWTQEHLRERQKRATLVMGGRKAGKSQVVYFSPNLELILFRRDFFISMLEFKVHVLITVVFILYIALTFFWSLFYWLIMKYQPGCIYGATTFVEVWIYSFITMATIGYGNTGPQQCWSASVLVSFQGTVGLLLDAVVLGIIFARISHPKQRSRSIFISDSAVICRRDGVLKFMFRVADIRKSQVVDPKIKAYLYTWGEGRITAEGERVPVRVEELDIGYIDGMLILPLTIEHTIDEVSPLCGHTHDSLDAMAAEIVITFEGTTEFGNPFMARRSYVSTDIEWGHTFVDIIRRPGHGETKYTIDLNAFHDVLAQPGLPPLPRSALSRLVVNRAKRTVPYPLLGSNTLVLSDSLCLFDDELGRRCLAVRVADTYPNQVMEITVKTHLYRWNEPGADPPFECIPLECGYKTGTDRIYLRLPVEVIHVIDETSPLANWLEGDNSRLIDADAEITVLITGYLFFSGHNVLRQRTYSVANNIRVNHKFVPIVKHPDLQPDKKPFVRWAKFHDTALVNARLRDLRHTSYVEPILERLQTGLNSSDPAQRAAAMAAVQKISPTQLEGGNDFTVANIDLARYAAAVAAAGDNTVTHNAGAGPGAFPPLPDFDEIIKDDPEALEVARMLPHIAHYALTTTDAASSLPHQGSIRPALPGPSHYGGRIMDDHDDEEDEDESWMQGSQERGQEPLARPDTERIDSAMALGTDLLGQDLLRYEPEIVVDEGQPSHLLPSGLPADAVVTVAPASVLREEDTFEPPGEEVSEPNLISPLDSPIRSEPEHLEDEEAADSPALEGFQETDDGTSVQGASRSSANEEGGEGSSASQTRTEQPSTSQSDATKSEEGNNLLPRAEQSSVDEEEAEANEEANALPIHLNPATSWARHRALTNLFSPPEDDDQGPNEAQDETKKE